MMKYIDADALARWLNAYPVANNQTWYALYQDTLKHISDMSAAGVAPVRRGRWTVGKDMPEYPRVPYHFDVLYCSECKAEAYWDTDYGQQAFDYCPNCGAKMDGGMI